VLNQVSTSKNLLLEQLVTLFMGALACFAQFFVMLFKARPNGFVIACAFEFFHFLLASFPIDLFGGEGARS
jgi:hypothetical protein